MCYLFTSNEILQYNNSHTKNKIHTTKSAKRNFNNAFALYEKKNRYEILAHYHNLIQFNLEDMIVYAPTVLKNNENSY